MAYATLGTYTGTCYNVLGGVITGHTYKATVQYEQDIIANLTRLKITTTVACTGSTGTASTFYFKLNGNDYEHKYINLGWGVSHTTSEVQTTVYHDTDGTKTYNLNVGLETEVSQGANANLNNYCLKRAVINQNITLPTIPRASSFTVPTFTCGGAGTINITPVVSTFTHKVYYYFGNTSGTISSSCTTSCSWTPSNDLAKQIPNATNGVGSIVVDTYNGSTKVGSSTRNFTLYVNVSNYPNFTSLSLTGNNLLNGHYVQGKSTVTSTINGATGSYGSTINSYNIAGQNLSVSSSSGTSSTLTQSGTLAYKATITDSRGRTATKQQSIYVYPYSSPTVTFELLSRATSDKVANEQGEYVKVIINYVITSINNANAKSYTLDYRVKGSNSWTSVIGNTLLTDYINTGLEITTNVKLSVASTYEFRIGVKDSYTTSYNYGEIGTVGCVLDFEQDGIGVGKYREKGMLDVAGDVYTTGSLNASGSIVAQGMLSSSSTVNGSTFVQSFSTYGTHPLEIGKYIDMHQAGSTTDVDVRLEAVNQRGLIVKCGNDLSQGTEIGRINNNASFIKNEKGGQFLTMEDSGRLTYDGSTVPHNWRQSFTPFIYSDNATWATSSAVGQATYLGDLIYIQGRVIADKGGASGKVCIGGLPQASVYNYPAVTIGFFGGATSSMNSLTYGVNGYIQAGSSNIFLNFTLRDANWQQLGTVHVGTRIDVCFSAVYRWR